MKSVTNYGELARWLKRLESEVVLPLERQVTRLEKRVAKLEKQRDEA